MSARVDDDGTARELIDAYLGDVLTQIPLRQAREAIAAELGDHIACSVADGQEVTEALGRLGAPETLGRRLASLHRPRTDGWLFFLTLALLLAGLALLAWVVSAGLSPTAQPAKLWAHGLAATLGLGLAALLWRWDYRKLRRAARWLAPLAALALLLAWAIGPSWAGRPYLPLGPLRIDVVGVSPFLFLLALAALLVSRPTTSAQRYLLDGALISAVLLPVLALPLLGGRLEAAFFLLAALVGLAQASGGRTKPPGWRQARRALYAGLLVGLPLLVLLSGPTLPRAALHELSLGSSAALPYAESDDLLGLAAAHFGRGTLALIVVLAAGLLLRVAAIARCTVDPFGRALAAGLGTLIAAAMTFSLLASAGVVILPSSGLAFPLCGYGGSALVTQLAALGLLLGVSRLRSLGSASC